MKATTENLSPEQSLDLIASMILEAKGKVQKNNFFFLLWGWVIVLANAGMYSLTQLGYEHPYVVWAITIPAWIITLIKGFNKGKTNASATHFDKVSGWLWICFGISISILIAFGYKINYQLNPLILTVTAIPTFVSGLIIKFKPLMIGGITFWIFGILGFLVPMETQPLIGAVAVICGYLIPGYLLKSEN
jgi:hypothetical protein